MGDEGQAYDLGGDGLIADDKLNRGAGRGKCGFDIAHGHGAIGGGAEAAGSDDTDLASACVGYNSSFTGGSAAVTNSSGRDSAMAIVVATSPRSSD